MPEADIHARGNEITVSGPSDQVALVVESARRDGHRAAHRPGAHARRRAAVARRCCASDAAERPAEVLTHEHPVQPRPHDPPEDPEPEALRRRDRQAHHRLRHRPGRHRQDLPRDGQGRAGAAGQAGQPHHPDPPAVEAGERLGFLPGTLYEKIDPYLRPLYDALHDMIDPESIPRLIAAGTIEVAPAGLHARPHAQRRVHHPRRGAEHLARADEDVPHPARASGRKMVVTGDVTQVDLPGGTTAGCASCSDILDGIDDVDFLGLTAADVVRHQLVGDDRRRLRPVGRSRSRPSMRHRRRTAPSRPASGRR